MDQDQSIDNAREGLAGKASRFLFGNDAFISYARRDATIYSLGLANQLTKNELSCFLDQWGTPAGTELPAVVVSTLKRSNMLILLGTERAAISEAVKREIVEFKKTGRTIIPVSFDGALEKATWYGELIAGISIAHESKEALANGKPSENVVNRIVNAENFTRRNKRLRNYFWITAASVVMMLLIGALAGFVIVSKANAKANDAEARRRDAVRLAEDAEKKREAAQNEATRLSTVAQQAQDMQKQAEGRAEDAAKKEAEASANAQKQQQLAIAQKRIADEQTKIADEQQQRSRRLTYIGNMQLAQQTFEVGKIDKTEKLLTEFLPANDANDLRGFEWFYLWNEVHRKQVELPLAPNATRINSLVFLADKKQFVTADYESLTLWDANSNQVIAKVDGRFDHVSSSRDGRIIAAAREKTIKLFNTENLVPVTGIEEWATEFRAIAFSPALESMLITADESEINVWEVTSEGMRRAGQAIPAPDNVLSVAFSPDGKHLGVESPRETQIWDIPFTKKFSMGNVGIIQFLPDNQTICFAGSTSFKLWDLQSQRFTSSFKINVGVPVLPGPEQEITAVISPDGRILATAPRDGVSYGGGVKFWDVQTGERLVTFDGLGLNGEVTALAFSRDGKTLAIGSKGKVQLSDATMRSVTEVQGTQDHVFKPLVSAETNVFVTSDGTFLYFWNSNTQQLEGKRPRKGLSEVLISADAGKYVTITSIKKRTWLVELFDSRSRLDSGQVLGETSDPYGVLSPDGKTLVLQTTNHKTYDCDAGCLQFWDIATGAKTAGTRPKKKNKTPSYGARPLMFSPNGKLLVFRNEVVDGHSIDILDVGTKRSLVTIGDFNEGDFRSFAFSPDGNTLAIASEDSTVSIWDVRSLYNSKPSDAVEEWKMGHKHFIALLEGHTDEVTSVAFSPDGQTLATGSKDGTVKLWNTGFYQPLLTLKGYQGQVNLVFFSADGRSLITAGSEEAHLGNFIKFWRAAAKTEVAAQKARQEQ